MEMKRKNLTMNYKKLFYQSLELLKEISINMSAGYNRSIYLKIKKFLDEIIGLDAH